MNASTGCSAAELVICPYCGEAYPANKSRCPYCTLPITETRPDRATRHLDRLPSHLPRSHARNNALPCDAQTWLQFLPSGLCAALPLNNPVLLGRQFLLDQEEQCDRLDLTDLGGFEHGVSRVHCLLQRRGTCLVVIDLGSSNGTYLNDLRLLPHQEYVLTHGDRLILGTLHAVVFFDRSGD
jgi:hypothetical protein